jgi:hypothetical protein
MGVEMASGWLAWLVQKFETDSQATDSQRLVVIEAAQGILTNAAFAWAAESLGLSTSFRHS